ncbi:putative Protein kinase domain containing protein [Blattamonas nauphoetae]|uniref:mitogen-activated protein kinase kinase n=1 Tax=Blattamonas nauphoetae TaxID=2049346 RepID=A0ABQ9XTH0_9EUKA|nr:putative Protein kinase domain containing protein [Blattamonas nauphoetae]
MDPVDVYRVMNGVLEGLSFLHSRNLAFGDLKPSNILIGKDGAAKLGDFGGVTQTDVQRTSDPKELGSMKFWPPEFFALNNSEPTIASDMWGFGMILLELMTGREWITGEQSVLLSQQIVSFDLQNAIAGFTENQKFLFRSLLAPNPQNRMTSSELLRSERLLHILGGETPLSKYRKIQIECLNAQISDLSARISQLESRSSTTVTPPDQVNRDDIVLRLHQALPTFKYPKLYLRHLVQKYCELGSTDVFKASYLFLKKEANEYKRASDLDIPNSIFSTYHRSHAVTNKYTQLAMKQLAIDFPSLPIPLITNAFKKYCRLYLPTDPHFDADDSLLDDDRFDEYCDMFHLLHHPYSRLPPLPTSLEDPTGNDDEVDVQLGPNEQLTCTECGRRVTLSDSIQCSKAHTLCLDCLRKKANESILHHQMTVKCGCKGLSDRERCTETINDTMLYKRIPEMISKLKQYKTVAQYPADTVQSGICPHCFFPLSAPWKEPHHYTCNNCNLHFHVE